MLIEFRFDTTGIVRFERGIMQEVCVTFAPIRIRQPDFNPEPSDVLCCHGTNWRIGKPYYQVLDPEIGSSFGEHGLVQVYEVKPENPDEVVKASPEPMELL